MKFMRKKTLKLLSMFLLTILLISCGNDKYKDYVINHSSDIHTKKDVPNLYKLDTCEFNYYTEVSIKLTGDSSYMIIFWGDRDSWLWEWKLDKYFTVDIPYNNYKNINTKKDIKIIEILNNIK